MNTVLDLGNWCILRTSCGDTLRLVKSLRSTGIEAWAPVDKRHALMPRTGAPYVKESALLPSYVFAPAEHVDELLRLEHAPLRAHPRFTVYRHNGGVPLIADDQLDALRAEEARKGRVFEKWRRKGSKPPKLERGTPVTLTEGAYAGITGTVDDTQGKFTVVVGMLFGRPFEVKVSSLLIAENVAQHGLPHGIAA